MKLQQAGIWKGHLSTQPATSETRDYRAELMPCSDREAISEPGRDTFLKPSSFPMQGGSFSCLGIGRVPPSCIAVPRPGPGPDLRPS